MSILVTGGAGFIGSNFVLDWLAQSDEPVITLDKLTYAGNIANLVSLKTHPGHIFVTRRHWRQRAGGQPADPASTQGNPEFRGRIACRPVHIRAGRIHSDQYRRHLQPARSRPRILESTAEPARRHFRFLHVSTDEVYGSLDATAPAFTESSRYKPNSPYSASKAASDHLVRAYHHTYGLPVLTTNCSNNYGPYHFPEKLIPWLSIMRWPANPCPYTETASRFATGSTSRTTAARYAGCWRTASGATYNVGGNNEKANLDVVHALCESLDELRPRRRPELQDADQLRQDRPGHDRRYAIDASRLARELGWRPAETFETGLRKTVIWYLQNPAWVSNIVSGAYRDWVQTHYQA